MLDKNCIIILYINCLPHMTYIKFIWGQSVNNKNSLGIKYYSPSKSTWRPDHISPLSLSPQEISHGWQKIKYATCLSQLQNSWRTNSQVSYWPLDWCPLISYARVITLQTSLPWQVPWIQLPSISIKW